MNGLSTGTNFTIVRSTFSTALINNVITVALCASITFINGILVHTFRKHQIFRVNPRYILFIHLVVNDIIMLTLFTLLHILSYTLYTISVIFCTILFICAVVPNVNTPFNLAVMAVECYIAVCFPLRHTQICTIKKTYIAIAFIWMISVLSILPDLFVVLATEPLEFFYSRVFCLRETIFRSPHLTQKRNFSYIVYFFIVWLTLFYTYFRILFAAKAAAADVKKARNTILLHGFQLLLCMLTYARPAILNGLTILFPKKTLAIRFSVSIFVQVLPRLISPIVYGIRDKTFRSYLKKQLLGRESTFIQPQKTAGMSK